MTADGILQRQDDIKGAFTRSVVLHVSLFGGLTAWAWWNNSGEPFGDPNAGGSAVGIEAVANIPLPSRGPQNPVANDTKSQVPEEVQQEKPAPKAAREPEPEDAIALLPQQKKQPLAPRPRLKSFGEIEKYQLRSKTPQTVSNPMFSQPGAGQVGLTGDTSLGSRFAEYASRIMDITRRNWRVQDVDRSITTGPPVTIRFDLARNGAVQNFRVIRASGIPTLDLSVRNAVENSQYPPLPEAYERSTATLEFTFELKR